MQAPASSGGYSGGNPYNRQQQQQAAPFVNVQNMQPVLQPDAPPPAYNQNVVKVPPSYGAPGMPPPQVPPQYAQPVNAAPVEHPILNVTSIMAPQQQQMGVRVAGQRTQAQMNRDAKRFGGCCCCLLCGC